MLPQRLEIDRGLYILSSKLGWFLTGRTYGSGQGNTSSLMFVMTYGSDSTTQSAVSNIVRCIATKPDLKDFWSIESLGITDNPSQSNDDIALQKFKYSQV